MEQYQVTGMTCAACSTRVEKAVSKVPGVTACSVSLLTNSMGVEGTATCESIIKAVQDAGYQALPKQGKQESEQKEVLADHETPVLKRRLVASLGFLAVLMYFSMGHMMWGWPIPGFFSDNHVAMGLIQMLLTIAVMVINQKFFISGFKSLVKRAPNMDTLVALGASAAFFYSTYALFAMTDAQVRGDMDAVMNYMHEFYFESAAMILALITVGKMLEARSKGKTTDALKSLMKLAPKTAVILKNGEEIEVPISQVKKGDLFVVRPGESIPVDGMVLEGNSAVNEAALTGESIPADKAAGDTVSAATINQSGFLKCEATRVGEDTTLSGIIRMVSDAASTKAPIAKVADRVSGIFVPTVIGIAIVTVLGWLFAGKDFGFALARGISVLVISCPCALGLATPVAIMVGSGMGARNGILFKTAASLEETGRVSTVVLDKTGTITSGEPKVTDVIPAEGVSENELVWLANALEKKSEHPMAKAILQYAQEHDPADKGVVTEIGTGIENSEQKVIQETDQEVSDFKALPGNGLSAIYHGQRLLGGSLAYITRQIRVEEAWKNRADRLAEEGKTPLLFAWEDRFLGIISVADVMKSDSAQAVKELQNMGLRVVMLTGDNERTARAIGQQAGVNEVIAGVLPDGKEQAIRTLQERGKVAMVGDGINDAPALTRADIGIAIGAGTDIAIDAADVVLMKSRLCDVAAAVRLSRATLRNIHQNLFWAFFYNVIGIPLAAGIWIPVFGWQLSPMFAAAAMSLSSFCVVTNALRLNLFQMYDGGHDRKRGHKEDKQEKQNKEALSMEKTLKIEGMMCGHCEASVKKALEALAGVKEAAVSHETGTAVVTLEKDVADELLKETVEAKDYKVLEIR